MSNNLLFSSQYFRLYINMYVLPHISENLRPANVWQFYMWTDSEDDLNQYKYTLFSCAPLIIHGATFFFYSLRCWKCYYTDWELSQIHIKHDKAFSTFLNLLSSCRSCSQNQRFLLCLLQHYNPTCCDLQGKYICSVISPSQTLYVDHQSNWYPLCLLFFSFMCAACFLLLFLFLPLPPLKSCLAK